MIARHRRRQQVQRPGAWAVLPPLVTKRLTASVLIATVSVMVAILFPQEAFGQGNVYAVSELPGANVPRRLNNLGDVAGKAADPATGEGRATTWSHGGLRRKILGKLAGGDYSSASGINDGGQVAGSANISSSVVPFLWIAGNGFRRIPLLPGDNGGQAQAINRHGHVVGYSSGASGKRAFLWRQGNNNARDLGVLAGGNYSSASDINDADDVVGTSGTATGDHAVLWTSAGETIDLGTLPGDTASEATGINNNGVVIGYSKGVQGTHAFLWTRNDGMQALGVLPGGSSSRALGINDSDTVVGTSTSSLGDRAFVWNIVTGIKDLNSEASLPFGVVLLEAHAINNRGQILVLGMNMHEHEPDEGPAPCAPAPPSSFLLTPQ